MGKLFRLPGGRGEIQGANAESLRDQDFRSRQQELPEPRGWVISLADLGITRADTNFVGNQFRLFPLPDRSHVVDIRYARLYCIFAVASSWVKVALYSYRSAGEPQFKVIPKTEVQFDTSSTGLLEVELPSVVTITPSDRLYLGWIGSSAGIDVAGFPSTGAVSTAERTAKGYAISSVTSLPGQVKLSELETAASHYSRNPDVLYLSTEAAKVL